MGSARAQEYKDINNKADLDQSVWLKKRKTRPNHLMTKESQLTHYVAKLLESVQNPNMLSSHHNHHINTWKMGSDMIKGRSREPIGKGSCTPVHNATWLNETWPLRCSWERQNKFWTWS